MTEEPNWRKIAHDLAYMISFLKDDPTSIKTWEKVFKHMEEYKEACKMEYPAASKPISKADERRQQYFQKLKDEKESMHKNPKKSQSPRDKDYWTWM